MAWYDHDPTDFPARRLHPAIYECLSCSGHVSFGDAYCSHCGSEFSEEDCHSMKANLTKVALKRLLPLGVGGWFLALRDQRRADWQQHDSRRELHPHVFGCIACPARVAWGDAFCRACGIKFTPEMCSEMKARAHLTSMEALPSAVLMLGTLWVVIVVFVMLQ